MVTRANVVNFECPRCSCMVLERENEKTKEGRNKGTSILNHLEVTSAEGGFGNNEGKCNNNGCQPTWLHL